MKFKFIHCADLHLGVRQYGLERRYADFFRNFEAILNKGTEKKIDFMIMVGDIFDSRQISPKTLHDFIELVKNRKFPIIVINGNHDKTNRYDDMSWLEYLAKEGFITFVDGSYEHENIRFYGFESATKMKKWAEKNTFDRGEFTILMLHEGITGQVPMVNGIEVEEIPSSFDYVALGHFHKHFEFPEKNVYNPGSIERTKIDDDGGGYFLVDVKDDKKTVTYHELEKRDVQRVVLDVTEARSEREIESMIDDKIKDIPKTSIIELTLSGHTSFKPDVRTKQEKMNDKYFFVKIRNHILPVEVDLPVEFGDELENKILSEHFDENDVSRVIELRRIMRMNPSPEEVREILRKEKLKKEQTAE